MPKVKISEFSATPASNTDIDGINIAEGCAPSGINDAIRELMAQLKDFQTGAAGDSFNGPVGTSTAAAGAFTTLAASGAVTLSGGTANGVAYLNGSKVLTTGSALTFDGTTLGVGIAGSAWDTLKAIDLGSGGAVYGTAGQGGITANAYYATSGFVYKATNGASLYQLVADSHRWSTAASGTGGTGITFAEQMRLTSTGLGIGTSSPGAKLHVQDTTVGGTPFRITGANSFAYNFRSLSDGSTDGRRFDIQVGSSSGQLSFSNSSVEFARFDSSGNLGLGVTPSAWQTGGNLDGTNQFTWSSYDASIGSNYYYNSGAKYKASGLAVSAYQPYGGAHKWFTAPSGTAGNAISFTQAMTLDASGNLGVGTTSPGSYRLNITGGQTAFNVVENTAYTTAASVPFGLSSFSFNNNTAGAGIFNGHAVGALGGTSAGQYGYWGVVSTATGFAPNMVFGVRTGSATYAERARIDSSGNLLVGTTSSTGAAGASHRIGIVFDTASAWALATKTNNRGWVNHQTNSTGGIAAYFEVGASNTNVGAINTNATTTTYATSSDYRLKNTIAPMTGALAKVALLKPCTYKWNADGSDGEGFIAHELAEVVPQCVTGEKDAVDAEGKPQYQGIDTSFLVATLTAAIQELKAEFDAYKATHP
jgi:hypothetical protein